MKDSTIRWLIIIGAALLFIPGLGGVHLFDWDEINFAEIAREMILTGDYLQPQIDFKAFYEKPPFFIWLQALSMNVFGVGEFGARFPNAICGILTLLVLFNFGKRSKNSTFGVLWVLAYVASILPQLYFHSGIIDPWFNLFMFLALSYFITDQAENYKRFALSGVFLGLATLTKGPVGLLIPGLTLVVMWSLGKRKPLCSLKALGVVAGVFFVTVSLWGVVDLIRNGPDFMIQFFWRQVALLSTPDAGHSGFIGYHFIVLLLGCFPASVFAIQEMVQGKERHVHRRWMLALFWVVLILFSLVQTKIVHYSSMCYFPLTYLAALQVYRIWTEREAYGWSRFLLGGIGTLIAGIFILAPLVGINISYLQELVQNDPFTSGNLEADVHWTGFEMMSGLLLYGGLLSAHFLHGAGKYRMSLIAVALAGALFVPMTLYFFIGRIEGYSQLAAIEFCEARQGEDCYVVTEGHKSYAQLFYTRKQIPLVQPSAEALLETVVHKPVYVICKIQHAHRMESRTQFEKLYAKNGFVFFKRRSEVSP